MKAAQNGVAGSSRYGVGLPPFLAKRAGWFPWVRSNIMKYIIALTALLLPAAAAAQSPQLSSPEPTMNMPNYSTFASSATARQPLSETPTMKRQKLERAIALRAEAATLVEQDGGTLTAKHAAYIRRKARAILSDGR
jgi:hypothetical protein